MKNKIEKLGYLTHIIVERNKEINRLRKENEESTKLLKKLASDEEIKQLIINHLHIEDNGEPRKLSSEYTCTTRDGIVTTSTHDYDNPNASFNPELDEFDIVDVEFNYIDMKMRIMVDCIRRHRYINAFMWEPDYYWTDYIELSEFGEFDIVDVESNYIDMKMRIMVDCIRRHRYINAFMCEPDYIDLSEFGEINRD